MNAIMQCLIRAYHFTLMIQRIWRIVLIPSFVLFAMAAAPVCFAETVNQSATEAGFQMDNSALSGISNPDQPIVVNNSGNGIDNDYPCQKIRNPKVSRIKNKSKEIDNDNARKIKNRNRNINNPAAGNIVNRDQNINNPETVNVANRDQGIDNPEAKSIVNSDQSVNNSKVQSIENRDQQIKNNTPGISNPEAPGIANSDGSISNPDNFIVNGYHYINNPDHFVFNFDWAFLGVYNWNIWYQPFFSFRETLF